MSLNGFSIKTEIVLNWAGNGNDAGVEPGDDADEWTPNVLLHETTLNLKIYIASVENNYMEKDTWCQYF